MTSPRLYGQSNAISSLVSRKKKRNWMKESSNSNRPPNLPHSAKPIILLINICKFTYRPASALIQMPKTVSSTSTKHPLRSRFRRRADDSVASFANERTLDAYLRVNTTLEGGQKTKKEREKHGDVKEKHCNRGRRRVDDTEQRNEGAGTSARR